MQKFFKKGIFLLLLMLVSMAHANYNNKPLVTDPNKPIIVKSSSAMVKLTLAANPTTGYSWFLQSYDHKLLTPANHDYIAPMEKMPGAGGHEEWVFKVNSDAFIVPQTTTISMVYARPWEMKNVKPVVFKIVTQEAN